MVTGGILAACSVGGLDLAQPDPRDTKPPSIMDRIRSLDISPRSPGPAQVESPDTPSSSRAQVYPGNGAATVAQPPGQETAAAPTNGNGEGYDLNFENAPVSTLAKVILGDI